MWKHRRTCVRHATPLAVGSHHSSRYVRTARYAPGCRLAPLESSTSSILEKCTTEDSAVTTTCFSCLICWSLPREATFLDDVMSVCVVSAIDTLLDVSGRRLCVVSAVDTLLDVSGRRLCVVSAVDTLLDVSGRRLCVVSAVDTLLRTLEAIHLHRCPNHRFPKAARQTKWK